MLNFLFWLVVTPLILIGIGVAWLGLLRLVWKAMFGG